MDFDEGAEVLDVAVESVLGMGGTPVAVEEEI